LADGGNCHTASHSFKLQRETYSRYWFNSGKPISAISWLASRYQLFAEGAPLKWISHIFWLKGTVQRKLTGVQCDINRKFFFSH
jgi:hypothetical protein